MLNTSKSGRDNFAYIIIHKNVIYVYNGYSISGDGNNRE